VRVIAPGRSAVIGRRRPAISSGLRADLERYPGTGVRRLALALPRQGFWAVAVYRLGRRVQRMPPSVALPMRVVHKVLKKTVEVTTGIGLGTDAQIGPGLYIGHFGQIFVSPHAVIGRRCNLSPGVSIGVAGRNGQRGAPRIGDEVYIGPGAKIIGPIRIGNGVAIGANAVVTHDVPDGVTVAGVPARIINDHGSRGLIDIQELAEE
jgi:serine O-acetyltransferase